MVLWYQLRNDSIDSTKNIFDPERWGLPAKAVCGLENALREFCRGLAIVFAPVFATPVSMPTYTGSDS